jgi:Protein of unknown function (DUF5672)
MTKKIAIVIPIYKSEIDPNELKSLNQCQLILSDFPICFAYPEGMDLYNYQAQLPNSLYISFDKKYFKNIASYSQLMLSPLFYKTFLVYEYILIYQLDAYVFKNDLMDWADKNYDYIGAPWLSLPPLTKGKPMFDMRPWFLKQVGNGGFSLRKVKSHYRNTIFFRLFLKYFIKNEDLFWGVFINWLNPFFKKPKAEVALYFAFEMEPRKSYELTAKQLPFGVHAWEKYEKEFWEEWIN